MPDHDVFVMFSGASPTCYRSASNPRMSASVVVEYDKVVVEN